MRQDRDNFRRRDNRPQKREEQSPIEENENQLEGRNALTEALKSGSDVIGNHTRIKVVKNKLAPPFRTAEFDIMFGEGISKAGTILDLAVEYGLIQKTGSWFAFEGEKIGQGKDNVKKYLNEHPELYDILEKEIRARLGNQ